MLGLDLEEAEGLGLNRCGAGEDVGGDGSLGRGLNAVANEGGEFGEQCPEAMDGKAFGSIVPGGLGADPDACRSPWNERVAVLSGLW